MVMMVTTVTEYWRKNMRLSGRISLKSIYAFSGNSRLGITSRKWLELPLKKDETHFDVRVMQYNILAPCYTYPSLFPNCTDRDLTWSRRCNQIVK